MSKRKNLVAAACVAAMAFSLAPPSGAQPPAQKPKKAGASAEAAPKDEKVTLRAKVEQAKRDRGRHEQLKQKAKLGKLSAQEKQDLEALDAAAVERVKQRHILLEARQKRLASTFDTRRRTTRRRFLERWGRALLESQTTRDELSKHGRRMARLTRVRGVAHAEEDAAAKRRANVLLGRERARHQKRMSGLAKK